MGKNRDKNKKNKSKLFERAQSRKSVQKIEDNERVDSEVENNKIEDNEIVDNEVENNKIGNNEMVDSEVENNKIENNEIVNDKEKNIESIIEIKVKEIMGNSMEDLEKKIEEIVIEVVSNSGENIKTSVEKHVNNLKNDIDNAKNDLNSFINDKNDIIISEIEYKDRKIKGKLDNIEKQQNQQNNESRRSFMDLIKGQDVNKKLDNNFRNLENNIENKFNLVSKDVSKGFKRTINKIDEVNDIVDELKILKDNQNKILQSVQVLEGKIKSLDKINDIKESVEKISKEFKNEDVASNLEEEVLINLGKYGQKILNELLLSARCYAQNKDCIESIDNERKEYQNKIEQTKKDYESKGISEGRLVTLKEIIDKCDGIDKIYDSKEEFEIIIRDILKNNGYERDEELLIGKEIVVTEENKDDIQKKALNCETLGTYKVKKSAILLNENIEERAILEKMEDEITKEVDQENEEEKDTEKEIYQENEDNKEVENTENKMREEDKENKVGEEENYTKEESNEINKISEDEKENEIDEDNEEVENSGK